MTSSRHAMWPLVPSVPLLVALSTCISRVDIEGAPCPCPDGFFCCPTLGACVADENACPGEYPSSGAMTCTRDSDCLRNEMCHSWGGETGEVSGSQQCRRDCAGGFPCAAGEKCSLVPHDGAELADIELANLCVADPPQTSCAGLDCSECVPEQMGKTYCDGRTLMGCFFTLHEVCGLVCRTGMIVDCGDDGCGSSPEGADCNSIIGDVHHCAARDCTACAGGPAPDESVCVGDEVHTCMALPYAQEPCDTVCVLTTQSCTSSGGCLDVDEPHCSP